MKIKLHGKNVSSNDVNIKLHNANQPHCLLNSGYIYDGDLKAQILKLTSMTLSINIELHTETQLIAFLIMEIVMT